MFAHHIMDASTCTAVAWNLFLSWTVSSRVFELGEMVTSSEIRVLLPSKQWREGESASGSMTLSQAYTAECGRYSRLHRRHRLTLQGL